MDAAGFGAEGLRAGAVDATGNVAAALRQQLPPLPDWARASVLAAAITKSGACTRCDLAHATFWAFVKQQHFFQHCSAVRQPH